MTTWHVPQRLGGCGCMDPDQDYDTAIVELSRGSIRCTIVGRRALPACAYDIVAALAQAIEAADEDLAHVIAEHTEDA